MRIYRGILCTVWLCAVVFSGALVLHSQVKRNSYFGQFKNLGPGDLLSVWGPAYNNVFAVGANGRIFHYDGRAWTPQKSDNKKHLIDIWGTSGSDVFAVGFEGTVLHYDGKRWQSQQTDTKENLFSVWGTSASNVFAVGGKGVILRYDGQRWTSMTSPTSGGLGAVWASSPNDVFAVGSGCEVLHFEGTAWKTYVDLKWPNCALSAVWGLPSGTLYIAGMAKEQITFEEKQEQGAPLILTSTQGVIFRCEKQDCKLLTDTKRDPLGITIEEQVSYRGIWGDAPDHILFVGHQSVFLSGSRSAFLYNGEKFRNYEWAINEAPKLNAVWGFEGGEVFAVSSAGVVYFAVPQP